MEKLEWRGYTRRWKSLRICITVLTEYRRVTDRRTDGRTDILPQHSPRYANASRSKNCWVANSNILNNMFCRTRSLSNATFHFWSHDVHPVKICCCVQNFMKIGWFFTEIWRYINFQNGGHPPYWNCITTIRDHPRSLLLAAAACQISCQSDTQIWKYSYLNFSPIWLEMPIDVPKMGFWGRLWTPKCDYSSSRPPKGTSMQLRKSASFKLSTVKIRWVVWPGGELTESLTNTQTHTGKFIFCPCIA